MNHGLQQVRIDPAQTRQQLGISALSFAGQGEQSVLSLFS